MQERVVQLSLKDPFRWYFLVGLMRWYSKQANLIKQLDRLQRQLAELPPPLASTPVAPRRHKRHTTMDDIVALVRAYESGASSNQLCAQTGLAKGTILKLLRKGGAQMRRQGLSPDDVAETLHRFAAGQSLATIGRHFNVSAETVRTTLRKHGVTPRDPHGREQ